MTAILLHTDRTAAPAANRGSGRRTRWYHLVLGGYETIYASNGEPLSNDFVLDGVNLEVADTYLGLGIRDAIEAHVAEHYPGYEVVDTWPIARPVTADEF
jgi:hypothetical protein